MTFKKLTSRIDEKMLGKFVIFISLVIFLVQVDAECTNNACVIKCKEKGLPWGYCTSIPHGVCVCRIDDKNPVLWFN